MNKSLMDLQQEVHRVVSAAQRDRDKAQQSQDTLAEEMKALRERFRRYQERYQMERNQVRDLLFLILKFFNSRPELNVMLISPCCFQQAAERRVEEAELQRLKEDLEDGHDQHYLMLKRLEDTEIERDRLLAELEEQEKVVHMIQMTFK